VTVRLIRTGTRGSSSWPGERSPTRGRIHLRRLYFVQESLLAVERRTIHCRKFHQMDACVQERSSPRLSTTRPGLYGPCESAAGSTPERLWETHGFRLPLRGVIRLWIGLGSLWNLDGPRRRRPAGRGRRAVSAEVSLIGKKRGYDAQGFDLCFHPRQLDFFQPENFVSVFHKSTPLESWDLFGDCVLSDQIPVRTLTRKNGPAPLRMCRSPSRSPSLVAGKPRCS
jgi:hypothetical protein